MKTIGTHQQPSSVWVQLYYEGKGEVGKPIKIRPIPEDVADLAKEAKKELELDAGLNLIYVYPPGTKPPFSEQTSIRGDKLLKELIEELGNKNPRVSIGYDHPLIVVAPDSKQANGEKCVRFG